MAEKHSRINGGAKRAKVSAKEPEFTTADVADALLFAKLRDGRVLQVCLSKEKALSVIMYAAALSQVLQLDAKEIGLEWDRDPK